MIRSIRRKEKVSLNYFVECKNGVGIGGGVGWLFVVLHGR